MSKDEKMKAKQLSIKLKTSFAINIHLEELDKLKKVLDELDQTEDNDPFIKLMQETLFETLGIVFPEPFEA